MQDVEDYAAREHLEDLLPLLRKGALIGQDKDSPETFAALSLIDQDTLHIEATRRWKQPWILYYTIVLNSIAAAVQGWDQTGMFHVSYLNSF